MARNAETEDLEEFVRRTLAVTDGEVASIGYYRLDTGKATKGAKKGAANVDWTGTPAEVVAKLQQRIRMLRGDGAPKIWVRAIEQGDSHPVDSITLEGAPDAADELDPEPGRGPHAPAEGLSAVAIRLIAANERLTDRLQEQGEQLRDTAVREALFALAAQSAQDGNTAERIQAALQILEPTIRASMPILIDRLVPGQNRPAPADVPDDAPPAERFDAAIVELEQLLARMAGIAAEDPSILTPERVGAVGAAIGRYAQPGPPPGPPPAQAGQEDGPPSGGAV